jgi:hypothetical protein
MRRRNSRGNSVVEFSVIVMAMVVMFIGTAAIGINMIQGLEVVQLTRDAASMYSRGTNFSIPSNQKVLEDVSGSLGLSCSSAAYSRAAVILSEVTYVDASVCRLGGHLDGNCLNLGKWVFKQQLVLPPANAVRSTSAFGTPSGVTIASDGTISVTDYANQTGAVVSDAFNNLGIRSWGVDAQNVAYGMPSGQSVYIAEVAAQGYVVPGFTPNPRNYNYAAF